MDRQPERFFDTTASRLATTRRWLGRVSRVLSRITFRIKRGTPAETIAALDRQRRLPGAARLKLFELARTTAGAAFIDEKVQAINRAAFHRSAFAVNALTHLLFVDLAAQVSLSLPGLKYALVAANLALALLAHGEMRSHFRALLAGPKALPPKRRLWGLFANPHYNRAVKRGSRPHANSAWREKSLYRSAYFVNAAAVFLGSQFIIAPERLIFPFGFLLGKLTGLYALLVTMFDVWRGIRAGEDARIAREREVAVYRDLDI